MTVCYSSGNRQLGQATVKRFPRVTLQLSRVREIATTDRSGNHNVMARQIRPEQVKPILAWQRKARMAVHEAVSAFHQGQSL